MKNRMFLVFGVCNIRDMPVIWEVGIFDDIDKAQAYADECTRQAVIQFNHELTQGFEIGDSIGVGNRWDPNAQYFNYHQEEDGSYSVDTEYRVRTVPVIRDVLHFNLLNSRKRKPSRKYDEDCNPVDGYDDDDEPFTYNLLGDDLGV